MTEVGVVALQLTPLHVLLQVLQLLDLLLLVVLTVVVLLVVMLLVLLMLLGVGPPSLFRRYKTKRCWLDY